MEIIGEAIKSVSDDTRIKYQHIPWRDFAELRDVLIHQYFGVDLEEIWTTIHKDIPLLKENLQIIIADL